MPQQPQIGHRQADGIFARGEPDGGLGPARGPHAVVCGGVYGVAGCSGREGQSVWPLDRQTAGRQPGPACRLSRARGGQCVFHCMTHGLVHSTAVAKTHFDLGRMHIDIYLQRIDLE